MARPGCADPKGAVYHGRVSQSEEQTGTRVRGNMVPGKETPSPPRWGRVLLTLQTGRVESRQKSCEYGGANSQNLHLLERIAERASAPTVFDVGSSHESCQIVLTPWCRVLCNRCSAVGLSCCGARRASVISAGGIPLRLSLNCDGRCQNMRVST